MSRAARAHPALNPKPAAGDPATWLLERARDGSEGACVGLVARYGPDLYRWTRARLNGAVRDSIDADDLVQRALHRGISSLPRIEIRGDEAFLRYLKKIVLNEIRDEARRVRRRPRWEELTDDLPAQGPSALDRIIRIEEMERFRSALSALPAAQRQAVVLRFECGLRHKEIASIIGTPTANAARAVLGRGLARLARTLQGPTPVRISGLPASVEGSGRKGLNSGLHLCGTSTRVRRAWKRVLSR
jgi:RNA polymerase sigma factor (sigma-70 family)